jgi:predicted transcriptional regulator of viral defense system
MEKSKQINIENWIEIKLSEGRYSFSLSEIKSSCPEKSEDAIKFALGRLSKKNKILSIHKGYYTIIPPQYLNMGFLPVASFIDQFMSFLGKKYYVSLLSAAALHGSSHQQPQEFFVTLTHPAPRPTKKKDFKINYTSIKNYPDKLIVKLKTESGYINVSNPVLTAVDLVHFVNKIGGFNRIGTVINELCDEIKPKDFNSEIMEYATVASLQKLGYIFDFVCGRADLADALYENAKKRSMKFFRKALSDSRKTKGYVSNNRWKVIVNTEIEIDE